MMKHWYYSPSWCDQLLYHSVSPVFLYHSISFSKVFEILEGHVLFFFPPLMFAQSHKLRWQGRATSRYSISSSYFSHTWKQSSERTAPLGRILGKGIILGCHICGPFLATLFTIHSRLSLPPPELGVVPPCNLPFVICSLSSASVNRDAAGLPCPETWKCQGTWNTLVGLLFPS